MTVLDLPQIHQRPSASTLLAILSDLSVLPSSWEGKSDHKPKIKSDGIPAYLTSIISSPLAWIESDELKEQVWDETSKRLGERSGRTGMGSFTRTFKIPLYNAVNNGQIDDSIHHTLELVLHEPALTADNLGLKTWASSYMLAKRLPILRSTLPRFSQDTQILELGSGTGLVGLTAASVFNARVVLTDLPDIVPNLSKNVLNNAEAIATSGGSAEAAILDWTDPGSFTLSSGHAPEPHSFPLILAADSIYSSEHPKLLVQAVQQYLSRVQDARMIVELPLRDSYSVERADLKSRLIDLGLHVFDEGEDVGYDDWMDGDEPAEVRCWWSVWGWS